MEKKRTLDRTRIRVLELKVSPKLYTGMWIGVCFFFKKVSDYTWAHEHASRPNVDDNIIPNLSLRREPRVVASRAVFKDTHKI